MRARDIVKSAAGRFGIELRRAGVGGSDPFIVQRELLRDRVVSWVIDGGSNTGRTAQRYIDLFPAATVIGFEPCEEPFREMVTSFAGEARFVGHRAALADIEAARTLHLNAANETSSLFPAAATSDAYFDPSLTRQIGIETVPTTTVQASCQRAGIDVLDILKLDVQGAELLALRGAEPMLMEKRIRLLYLEVLFAPLYDGQANFWDVASLLDRLGYRCYGLYDMRRGRRGSLVQADAIYLEPGRAGTLPAHW